MLQKRTRQIKKKIALRPRRKSLASSKLTDSNVKGDGGIVARRSGLSSGRVSHHSVNVTVNGIIENGPYMAMTMIVYNCC